MTTKPPVRFTKVHAVSLHHKAIHVPAFVTHTQAIPQLFLCIDYQTRFVVIMKGTETHKLLAALRESDAAATNEPHQLMCALHPLDLSFVDQHPVSKKLSSEKCLLSLLLSAVRV
jgi:hypothetical protein